MNYKILTEIFVARRKIFLLIFGLVLLDVSLYAYLTLSQNNRLAVLQNEWFKMRQDIKSGTVVDGANIYARGTHDLAIWRERILLKKDFAKFLGELFDACGNNKLGLKGITYKPTLIKEENLLTYTITFNVSGKYAAIKSFLSDLARFREILTIDSIGLSNSSAIEESVELKVQITTYFKMEGA